jgi:hypothetical protein
LLNTTGDDNTAVGTAALALNTHSVTNVAVGVFAAQNNDSSGTGRADFNTAVGGFALQANVDGRENTAVGAGAIESGDGGNDNTAVGFLAGNNITGNSNTCLGHSTGSNLTTDKGNIYIGVEVQAGDPTEPEFIRIGNDTTFAFPYDTFIAGIQNRAVSAAANPHFVLFDNNGKLGTVAVNEIGGKTTQHQAMLDEFLKEHLKVEELQATVAQQQKQIEALTAGHRK